MSKNILSAALINITKPIDSVANIAKVTREIERLSLLAQNTHDEMLETNYVFFSLFVSESELKAINKSNSQYVKIDYIDQSGVMLATNVKIKGESHYKINRKTLITTFKKLD